jgi:hypothetical protein
VFQEGLFSFTGKGFWVVEVEFIELWTIKLSRVPSYLEVKKGKKKSQKKTKKNIQGLYCKVLG